jgi:hypothetical protein
MRPFDVAAAALLLLASCQRDATAPWLTMPTVASHAAWFPIDAGSVHGAEPPACDGCHADTTSAPYPPSTPSTTFRTFTCTGCHVQVRSGVFHDQPADLAALHAGVPTWAATLSAWAPAAAPLHGGAGPQTALDGACRACHPTGLAADHSVIFPLPHRDPAATIVAGCTDCHRDPADRTRLGCSACHPHEGAATATAHAGVPDFVAAGPASPAADIEAASALCARCHAEGTVPVTVAGHAAASGGFVVGSGTHAGTAGGACLDCHPWRRTLPAKLFAADFPRFTCGAPCHGAVPTTVAGAHDDAAALGAFHAAAGVDFAGKVAAVGFDAACRACHPDGAGGGLPLGHPFPIGDPPSHPPSACAGCHTDLSAPTDPTRFDCATCHLSLDPALAAKHASPVIPVTDYTTESGRCLFCHGEALVYRAAAHPLAPGTPLDGNPTHVAPGCTACHQTARLDMPFTANWGHQTCSPCHAPGGP